MRRVYRYEVAVDDRVHDLTLSGEILAVGCRFTEAVEFWAEYDSDARAVPRTFQVFGTGHEIPHNALHHGTAVAPGGALVWHLFELLVGEAP